VSKEDRMIELLEELVKWTRVTSFPKVKELLIGILTSPEEKVAYQSSDGGKTSREVADIANVSQFTISKWWKAWIKAGIAESISVQRGERAKRIFSLDDFGIEVPVTKEAPVEEKVVGGEET
jgi:hypothetical protein